MSWDKDNLFASEQAPTTIPDKKKSLAIFKSKETKLTTDNTNAVTHCVEFTNNHLNDLQLLTKEVFYPLLRNPNNRNQYAGHASRDMLFKFNNFISTLYVLVGQSQGRTLLPFPPLELYDENVDNQQKLMVIESFVNGWIRQLKVT